MFTENFDFWRHFHEKLTYGGGGGGGGGGGVLPKKEA